MGVSDFLAAIDGDGEKPDENCNIHYNGQKPWKDLCPNFDIWWECYRKSPVYDPGFYFKFFYNRIEPLERLTLKERLKLLARYFVYGRRKNI